jgi:hypothetical protein
LHPYQGNSIRGVDPSGKCTNTPPVGASPFVTFDGLPSDHYLWLTGQGARLLRGEIAPSTEPPERAKK